MFSVIAFCFCFPAFAEDYGLVVQVDGEAVYLNTTFSTAAVRQGMQFAVFERGKQLIDPMTGAELGAQERFVASGEVIFVRPKYAVGKITVEEHTVRPGQSFRWTGAVLPVEVEIPVSTTLAASAPVSSPSAAGFSEVWQSRPLDFEAVALCLGDFDGDGENEIAVSSRRTVKVYKLKDGELSQVAETTVPAAERILSLDSAAGKTGRVQLFAPVYDQLSEQFATNVYELSSGALEKTAALKWLVRSVKTPDGQSRIYAQEVFTGAEPRFSAIKPISGEDFKQDKTPLNFKGLNWLYGFTLADLNSDGAEEAFYTTDSGKIRAQGRSVRLGETEDGFGGTPNALRVGKTLIKFPPRLAVVKTKAGAFELIALKNIPKDMILSEKFGRYKDAELVVLKWKGSSFKAETSLSLGAYSCDFDFGKLGEFEDAVVAAPVGEDGKTVIRVFKR